LNRLSGSAIGIILATALVIRLLSIDFSKTEEHIVTDYDALGYYLYLPALFVYHDIRQFDWLESIDEKYKVVGGEWRYQIAKHKSGHYVTSYLGGVAILQLPFFLIGHAYASMSSHPADGFSVPYQMAISFGLLVYFILALLLLRKILLRYFSDEVVAAALFFVFMASNALEYIAIEAGQSHGYLLIMYVLMLWFTIRWHDHPQRRIAFFVGLTIGLATIMRPTELIIFLIPLLWDTQDKSIAKGKWNKVRQNRTHVYWVILGAFLGALPQLIYWQYVTGSPIYSIGSKWYFLNPYFRVLFGWQKGWFIYTPITIFFVIGLFFMKGKPFRKSVLWFSLLNIWIVIAWSVWRYGGSYSTRALVQSYPVFTLAFACFVAWAIERKWRIPLYIVAFYLTAVNLFQIWQYRQGILLHDEMNRPYYQAVYLDHNPTWLDMSLLDGGEKMPMGLKLKNENNGNILNDMVTHDQLFYRTEVKGGAWLDIRLDLRIYQGFWNGQIEVGFKNDAGKDMDVKSFRTFHYLSKPDQVNGYHMQVKIPEQSAYVEMRLRGKNSITGKVEAINVRIFE